MHSRCTYLSNSDRIPLPTSTVRNITCIQYRLEDNVINAFCDVISACTKFTLQNVLCYYQSAISYIPVLDKDDIQILYDGAIGSDAIGHYCCVRYAHSTRKVFVYDSLNYKLSIRQRNMVKSLYPYHISVIYVNVQRQPDMFSCGIFALAFATSLAIGRDPENEIYTLDRNNSTTLMRDHVVHVLTSGMLTPYPNDPRLKTTICSATAPNNIISNIINKKQPVGRPRVINSKEQTSINPVNKTKYQTKRCDTHCKVVRKAKSRLPSPIKNLELHKTLDPKIDSMNCSAPAPNNIIKNITNKKCGRPKKQPVGRPRVIHSKEQMSITPVNKTKYQTKRLDTHRTVVRKAKSRLPSPIKNLELHKTDKTLDPTIDSMNTLSLKYTKLGVKGSSCDVCGAVFFHEEMGRKEWCCGKGKYHLGSLPALTAAFYRNNEFINSARVYNNLFAFSALGVSGGFINSKAPGPSLVKIQGRTYHLLSNLNTNGPINNVILYIDDGSMRTEKATELKVNKDIFDEIEMYLSKVCPLITSLKQLSKCSSTNARIVFAETTRRTHGPVLGDKPQFNELAGILKTNDCTDPREVAVWKEGKAAPSSVSIFSSTDESLQYPLLFPQATSGWHPELVGPSNAKISQTKYYRMLLLTDNDNRFTGLKKLSQEYWVDMWSRAEEEKLLWVKREQTRLLRMATRQDIDETIIAHDGVPAGRVYLPHTFTNSPRHMQIKYMDAMAIVTRLGRPSFFITITSNPQWPEIVDNVRQYETTADRPDLCNRVFHLKLLKILQLMRSGKLFGSMISLLWVIEFQKRGLPHAHIAIRVSNGGPIHPDDIDTFVQAEIPSTDDELKELVIKHMIHGPCGHDKPGAVCNDPVTKKCTKKFPKPFVEHTYIDEKGYVQYKRSSGSSTTKRNRNIDARWVVPYNPTLLKLMNCHVNVEIASSVKVVKYLFKYIHKGPDKAKVAITNDATVNEIEEYVNLRYISASEAIWRILELDTSGRNPTVCSLPVHLPNRDFIIFTPGNEEEAKKQTFSKPMLYFLRPQSKEMSNITYIDFFEQFILHTKEPQSEGIALRSERHWVTKRKRGDCVARLQWISPSLGEVFYLRLLLIKYPAYSFEEIRTVNGVLYATFQEAAKANGLIDNNDDFSQTLDEAIGFMLGSRLRQLFVCIILVGAPAKLLWDTYKQSLSEDFLSTKSYNDEEAFNNALMDIDCKLRLHGKSCEEVGLPTPINTVREYQRELLKWDTTSCEKVLHEWLPKLTNEQKSVFNELCIQRCTNRSSNVYFLDGPGGSGKTTLIKVICAYYRAKKHIVLCTASTGVAALNYDGGVTAHSMFKLPLEVNQDAICSLSSTSQRAELIKAATLIVWDEASMAQKEHVQALDRTLRDFLSTTNSIFGGKLILFAGDFRQIPPVIKYGTPHDVITASIKNSYLWPQLKTLRLTQSQRSITDSDYTKYIMQVGNSEIDGKVTSEFPDETSTTKLIPLHFIETESTLANLISWVFPDHVLSNRETCIRRAILSGTNSNIDEINDLILERITITWKNS